MKCCNLCGEDLPASAFQRKASSKDGLATTCRRCDAARRIQRKIEAGRRRPDPPPGFKWCSKCRAEKPLTEFYVRQSGPQKGKPHAHCMECIRADNVARARARGVQPRQDADPLYVRKRSLAAFGLTIKDYGQILVDQGGVCPGCGVAAVDYPTNFSIDHDHACCPGEGSCGKCVRGLLCRSCNFAVGHAYDSSQTLTNLATYLAVYASEHLSDS